MGEINQEKVCGNNAARRSKRFGARELSFAALCLALSFVLSYVRLFRMPQGGSVTAASMLPLMAYSYIFGFVPGLIVSFAYGVLQFIQSPYILSPIQVLLDYPLPFMMMALCGLAPRFPMKKHGIPSWLAGIALAAVGRYLCHVTSGAVFFAEYAEGSGHGPLIYSAIYNSFVLVDAAVCGVLVSVPQVRAVFRRAGEGRLK